MTRKEFLRLTSTGAAASLAAATVPRAVAARSTPPRIAPPSGKMPSGATAAVVAFAGSARLDSFPDAVIAQARRCLIDGFAVMLAGAAVRGSAIVRDYVKSAARSGRSTVLGPERLSASAADAALANGASGHAMDYDDTQLSSTPGRVFGLLTHPTIAVLASALALGERVHAIGRALLEELL